MVSEEMTEAFRSVERRRLKRDGNKISYFSFRKENFLRVVPRTQFPRFSLAHFFPPSTFFRDASGSEGGGTRRRTNTTGDRKEFFLTGFERFFPFLLFAGVCNHIGGTALGFLVVFPTQERKKVDETTTKEHFLGGV